MNFLLLTIGLALMGAIQAIENIPPKKNLDVEKVVGSWYFRRGVNNMKYFLYMNMDVKAMNWTPEGNLELIVLELTDKCVEKKFLLKKTEKPAEFEIDIPSKPGLYTFSVMETDYENYILVCLEDNNAQEKMACAHYVRRPEENKGMQEFQNIVRTLTMPYSVIEVHAKDMCRV